MQIRFLFFSDGVISLSQWDVFSSAHGLESISSTTTDQDFVVERIPHSRYIDMCILYFATKNQAIKHHNSCR